MDIYSTIKFYFFKKKRGKNNKCFYFSNIVIYNIIYIYKYLHPLIYQDF